MSFPTLTVEIAFASAPLAATQTWTDVTTYMLNVPSIRRGRMHELDQVSPGTATVVLDNDDGRFSPTNTSSPYAGQLLPEKQLRISATWNSVTYRLFRGFIDGWPPEWPGGLQGVVTVRATDAFKYFALAKFTAVRSQELSSARISAVLNALSWPAADRAISTGQSQIQAGTLTYEIGLQHLQRVVDSENGLLFVNGSGNVVFHDRYYRLLNAATSVATFGAGNLQHAAIRPSFDESLLYNDVLISRTGGTAQSAEDATSKATYFPRNLSKTDLLITTDTEALDQALFLVARHKDPQLRIDSLVLDGHSDDLLWAQMLGREIGERVTVQFTPPGGGSVIDQDVYIEAVEHTIDVQGLKWQTAFQLSPALAQNYWIVDTSALGSTTVLAY